VRPGLNQNLSRLMAVSFVTSLLAISAAAQINSGPPISTTVNGHFLGPPATVTAPAARTMPNALPSVTSIPNYGTQFYHYRPYFNGYNGSYYGHGHRSGGWTYAIPYYYPVDNSAYGYDYVGGGSPDLYSGPPIGPNDPSLHMIVEQPPAQPYGDDVPDEAYAPPMRPPDPPTPPPADVKPGDPTVLVFRNGKQQEVTNYAIMGDSLYVFDQGRKKIALADLDIPATVKANDDRGVPFNLPSSVKKNSTVTTPQSSTPDQNTKPPDNIAAAMP
jgi:hypothetical protein